MSDDTPVRCLLLEACCDSVATARAAQRAGAGRIELCGAGDGGTTPSFGLIARVRDILRIPLAVMIRPNTGDFLYSDADIEVMHADIITARELGADAVVFGALDEGQQVDVSTMQALVKVARPMQVTCHRAFDRTPDAGEALSALLEVGVDAVLTSGLAATALQGAQRLALLQQQAGARLTVMAGGGVRAHNVAELLRTSALHAVHARATDPDQFEALARAIEEIPQDAAHE